MSDSNTQDTHPDTPDLPFITTEDSKPTKKKTAKKKTAKKATRRVKAEATDPTPAPQQEKEPTSDATDEKPRMGRVKGLGPVKKKSDDTPAKEPTPEPEQAQPEQPRRENNPQGNNPQGNNPQGNNPQGNNPQGNNPQGNNPQGNNPQGNNPQGNNPQGNNRRKGGKPPKKKRGNNNQNRNRNQNRNQNRERPPKRPIVLTGDPVEVNGMLEIAPKGFGFLRIPEKNFEQCKKDVFVPPDFIRKHGLRAGVWLHGSCQDGPRGPQLTEIKSVNDLPPSEAFKLPHFEELKAINPNRRIAFETTPERFTTRVLDIVSPVGRGQRGLIVSPPRTGKTTLLLHMAEAIAEKYDESIHLIILLVDERPEEVTEFKRLLPNTEIYASSNDDDARNHTRIAEMCIERCKRLVEGGKDVLVLMDSITRLARAYNNANRGGKNRGYQTGGIVAGALEMPRSIFAAARNTRNAGSLTILATALIQTNSRADEAIFQEFKGTGNMELMLDRRIAEQYIYPAVDIFKSGTRREELIMADHLLQKIHLIRRGLAGHRPEEAMERLIFFLKKFPNNAQMLMEIKG